jgi:hypothetical protein
MSRSTSGRWSRIQKGEHGVVLRKVLEETDAKTNGKKRSFKRFVVFNLEQTEPTDKQYTC